jgi:hypothetical protein
MGEAAAGISGCNPVQGLPDGGHQNVQGARLGGAQLRLAVLPSTRLALLPCDSFTAYSFLGCQQDTREVSARRGVGVRSTPGVVSA